MYRNFKVTEVTKENEEKYLDGIVDLAENDWGLKNINLIIDDSWQHYFSFEPKAEESRFPDMRKFIDSMHERGHSATLRRTSTESLLPCTAQRALMQRTMRQYTA